MATATKPRRERKERTANAAMRRRQIIEATIEAIVRNGLAATTLANVSEEAGLSQGVAVFYFKTKQGLLNETLRYHNEQYGAIWRKALDGSGEDPVDRLVALVLADLDDEICNARNLALWCSFWGEATARPAFAEICDAYDAPRTEQLLNLCEAVADFIEGPHWSPIAVAETLDAMTDGFWSRFHISPELLDNVKARNLLGRFLATVLPSKSEQILAAVERASSKRKSARRKSFGS